jgi:hypothetical protein
VIEPLTAALAAVPPHEWSLASSVTQQVLAVPVYRERVRAFLVAWQTHAPDTPPASVALALQSAAYTSARHRHAQSLELVWTDPAVIYTCERAATAAHGERLNKPRRSHYSNSPVWQLIEVERVAELTRNECQDAIRVSLQSL